MFVTCLPHFNLGTLRAGPWVVSSAPGTEQALMNTFGFCTGCRNECCGPSVGLEEEGPCRRKRILCKYSHEWSIQQTWSEGPLGARHCSVLHRDRMTLHSELTVPGSSCIVNSQFLGVMVKWARARKQAWTKKRAWTRAIRDEKCPVKEKHVALCDSIQGPYSPD